MARKPRASAAAVTPAPLPPLALPAELTIYTVGELHPQWLAWLGQAGADANPANPADADRAAAVHGAAVDQVDAAGLQLLLSLDLALQARGRRLHIDEPSTALAGGCQALGLGGWLGQACAPEAVQ